MYYPERIEAKIKSNLLKSCVAYNSKDEIVGHLSLSFESIKSRVGESGIAIVDTRYRGHGIFKNMRNFLYQYALDNKIIGIYGEAVTIHPYTQKGVLKLGGREAGFLLGYSPDNVSVKDIRENMQNRRQSIALMYTAVNPDEKRTVYLPEAYHRYAHEIYSNLGFKRNVVLSETSVEKADKELKGFDKVNLEPGAFTTVTISLDKAAFQYYDETQSAWTLEAGTFSILIGSSSRDIRLSGAVEM